MLASELRISSFTCLLCLCFAHLQVVIVKAVTVLCTMAEASGSFMQRRVIKDVIPSMTAFLDKQASVSLKAGLVYSQSQSFKQQLAVLRSLGRLCRQLEISEATLSSVVWVCAQYLSCRQPKELQQVGKMFQFMAQKLTLGLDLIVHRYSKITIFDFYNVTERFDTNPLTFCVVSFLLRCSRQVERDFALLLYTPRQNISVEFMPALSPDLP